MSIQDVLNIVLIFGIIIFIICLSIFTYFFVMTLKAIKSLTEDIKEKSRLRVLAAIPAVLLTLASKFLRKRR